MDLYEVEVYGSASGCSYNNTYKVVAKSITEAIEKTIYKMSEDHQLKEVFIQKIRFIESGIIV
jgi:hypothetical protein